MMNTKPDTTKPGTGQQEGPTPDKNNGGDTTVKSPTKPDTQTKPSTTTTPDKNDTDDQDVKHHVTTRR